MLTDLARIDARKAEAIELRFFGGLDADDVAWFMACSPGCQWITSRSADPIERWRRPFQARSNETHESKTDPDARLSERVWPASHTGYLGHVLMGTGTG